MQRAALGLDPRGLCSVRRDALPCNLPLGAARLMDIGRTPAPVTREGLTIRVRGVVQGVGFRPAVWRLAQRLGIDGEVCNDGQGVLIHARGEPRAMTAFVIALRQEAPPLARVQAVEPGPLLVSLGRPGFHIVDSGAGRPQTGVPADAATCPACLAEVMDPDNRRHRYPFTNCTHCGPRLSIIRAMPYDRVHTSMAVFTMCTACEREYSDPAERRFHAQPNACPECGPRVWIEGPDGARVCSEQDVDAVDSAARLIREGQVVAIKGIGGFHLACNAADAEVVRRLRAAKHREHKPFALMARDLSMVERHVHLAAAEAALLHQTAAGIVVLARRPGPGPVADAIAPGHEGLGFMLPYTPLHHLLMSGLEHPIVLTSGNRSDEPQCIANEEARERLAGIADAFLMHDRDIVNRLDDSVLRVMAARPRVLRRARGLAPDALPLAPGFGNAPAVLAMGAELKNTFCLLREGEAVVSQHIGDLEDATVHVEFRRTLELYLDLYRFEPARIAVDLHPDYHSTGLGRRLAERPARRLVEVQHHHAHAAAVMLEHGRPLHAPPVLAVLLDGLGMGDDGELWGGEFLHCDYRGYRRLGSIEAMPLPGGARAMREPWRNAYAALWTLYGWDEVRRRWPGLPLLALVESRQPAVLHAMLARQVNAPRASSTGRLFDAAAALLGVCAESIGYEGQAACELEALACRAAPGEPAYGSDWLPGNPPRIGWRRLWQELLDDLAAGVERERIAARFHEGVAQAVASAAARLAAESGSDTVVLGGGVMQNRLLLEALKTRLHARGLQTLTAIRLPAGDGGLSAGQAAIAAAGAIAG